MDESVKIELGPLLSDCPNSWANFIRHIQAKEYDGNMYTVSMKLIDIYLKEYNAIVLNDKSLPCTTEQEFNRDTVYLYFYDKKDYLRFIIRFEWQLQYQSQ